MQVLKPEDTRIKNATTILHLLLQQKSVSRVELSRITGLTKTTISAIVRDLMVTGIVEEAKKIPTGNVGKSPIPLNIKPSAVYSIGIYLGRTELRAVLMDARMNIVFKGPKIFHKGFMPKTVIKKIYQSIDEIIEKAITYKISIGALGIGAPGPLDSNIGIVKQPPKFRGWKDVYLSKILYEKYGLPVWIENDANLGALAEKWHGEGRKKKNFLYIFLNEGIGAGVVINNNLYRGSSDYVGEIGQSLVYKYGKFRYLENLCGMDVMIKKIRRKGFKVRNIEDIKALLNTNRVAITPIINDIAILIGAAIVNAIHILGPEAVFIGGKMSLLGDVILFPIKNMVSQYLFCDQKVEITFAEIREDAIAIGAAIYAITKWLENRALSGVPEERRWEQARF